MIIVEPIGGLCNRIRVINSAIFLAKELKKELTVIWRFSRKLNCSIFDLWKTPFKFNVIEYRNYNFIKGKQIRFKYRKAHFIGQEKMTELLKSKYDFNDLKRYDSIFIETWDEFYKYTDFDAFKPLELIQKTIDEYSSNFNNIIGVHIRRTDHIYAIKNSSTDKFIKLMKNEISKKPDTKFFLATDSKEEEDTLISVFGDRIIIYPKVLERNSPKGIQDALVDVMCLSKTTKILGSFDSSFSDIAARINGIERVIVTEDS